MKRVKPIAWKSYMNKKIKTIFFSRMHWMVLFVTAETKQYSQGHFPNTSANDSNEHQL